MENTRDGEDRAYICKKCNAVVPPRVWARQRKMCSSCYRGYEDYEYDNTIEKEIAIPGMLFALSFVFGFVSILIWKYDGFIPSGIFAIMCFTVAAITFFFLIKNLQHQKVEKPKAHAMQKEIRYACWTFIPVMICFWLYILVS